MKKIGCLILCVILSAMLMTACSSTYENIFIAHNYQRDYSQAIVTIDPITVDYKEIGKREDGTEWSYTSDEVKIYKSQLVNYINNYGSAYVNNYGMAYNDMVDYFMEQLILTELVVIEADVRLEKHDIFWTKDDIDTIQHSVYTAIDSYLNTIYNDILDKEGLESLDKATEHDHDALGDHDHDESTETTYPVMEEENKDTRWDLDEDERIYGNGKKHDDWYLNGTWFTEEATYEHALPGNYGNADSKSLAREGVKRLITMFEQTAKDLIGLTDEEKQTIESEIKQLKKTSEEQGVAYAYRDLGKTLMIKKILGDTYVMSQKMTLLQDFIESNVTISEQEIVNKYNKMLADQMSSFRASSAAYDTAATGTGLVLYRPNNNYVYVKHILIPFSDEQTSYLRDYKEWHTEDEYYAERERQVSYIKAYEHVNGEDDTTRVLSVAQIWSEVNATMARASASPFDAERTFNKLIYKYNTDPGIFNNETGYAVKYKLEDGERETYMTEFAEASRAFRDEGYKVGQIYDEYVITDYGVHIMYYAADYGYEHTLGLDSYITPGRYTTVRERIRDDLVNEATNAAYTTWQNERIYYYRNIKTNDNGENIVHLHEKAYKDLYQED